MAITPEDLEFQILRIYERLKIVVGGHVTESQLRQEWRKTRLRRDDLDQGIQLMIVRDLLKPESGSDESCLKLTQIGFDRVMKLRREPIRSQLKRMQLQTKLSLMRSNPRRDGPRRES